MNSRRRFIKTSGMAALSIPMLSGLSLGKGKAEVLKVGIIGCGDRGGGISRLLNDSSLIDVVACCDIIPFRLQNVAKNTGAKPYEDYRALIEDKNVEAVIIASPFGLHDEMAIDTIAAGKHIYCEKTMAKGMTEIQSVLDAHRNSNLVFQTGHQYNSSKLYQQVQNMVQSGYLGEINSIRCQWNRNGSWRREVPDPKWERMINWRMFREHSGGLVAELCSHQIDFICHMLGEAPSKIVGFGGIDYWKDGRETFDNVHLQFEFPSGVDASFTCTTKNAFEDYKVRILGSKATVILDYDRGEVFLESNEVKETELVDGVSGATKMAWKNGKGAPIEVDQPDATAQALEQFYRAVRHGEPVISNIRTGATTAKCVQMCLDSMYEDKIAHWKDYPELVFG